MAAAATSGRKRLYSFALSESLRGAALRFHRSIVYRPRYAGPTPDRLLIAPTDLRTADATLAHDIYEGRYAFAGSVLDADGASVFTLQPPSDAFARELHGFGWLRHLRASDMSVSRSNARALIRDWLRAGSRNHPVAFEPQVTARRVMSWLSQSPLVLAGCDHAFYRRFMKALVAEVRSLRRIAPDGPPGLPRLTMVIAVAAAAVALPDQDRFVRQAAKWLEAELSRQILPDGGHISRNPAAVLWLLTELLPLRQAFTARSIAPPPGLVAAIDRMMPMVRFFRHGDGAFARFNGGGDTPVDLIAAILAYDDARGTPLANAPHSGYQRLAAGTTTVICDTGRPPPIEVSGDAHAGCLSFELSTGRQLLVVNCGAAGPQSPRLRRLSRTTAAHSTASIGDSSSCRFLMGTAMARRFGEIVLEGPAAVTVAHTQEADATVIVASHDGYVERFGLQHERRLRLSSTGHRLEGVDRLAPVGSGRTPRGKETYAVRFHLHPSVKAEKLGDPSQVLLTLADGETWQFAADRAVEIEESIFFSDTHGNRRALQLVLSGRPQTQETASWWLQRTGLPGRRRGERGQGES